MNPWPFVIAAYALTAIGTLGLTGWSFFAMRRAEAEAEAVRNER
jgi:Flp pilus assembly protein CpaB